MGVRRFMIYGPLLNGSRMDDIPRTPKIIWTGATTKQKQDTVKTKERIGERLEQYPVLKSNCHILL